MTATLPNPRIDTCPPQLVAEVSFHQDGAHSRPAPIMAFHHGNTLSAVTGQELQSLTSDVTADLPFKTHRKWDDNQNCCCDTSRKAPSFPRGGSHDSCGHPAFPEEAVMTAAVTQLSHTPCNGAIKAE